MEQQGVIVADEKLGERETGWWHVGDVGGQPIDAFGDLMHGCFHAGKRAGPAHDGQRCTISG